MGTPDVILKYFFLSFHLSALRKTQQANTKMVISVLIMMMTISSLSLVEIVQAQSKCPVQGVWECPSGQTCVYQPDGAVDCCLPGNRPWQLDDGTMICCENGVKCPRTTNNHAGTRQLRDQDVVPVVQAAFVSRSISTRHFIDHYE